MRHFSRAYSTGNRSSSSSSLSVAQATAVEHGYQDNIRCGQQVIMNRCMINARTMGEGWGDSSWASLHCNSGSGITTKRTTCSI